MTYPIFRITLLTADVASFLNCTILFDAISKHFIYHACSTCFACTVIGMYSTDSINIVNTRLLFTVHVILALSTERTLYLIEVCTPVHEYRSALVSTCRRTHYMRISQQGGLSPYVLYAYISQQGGLPSYVLYAYITAGRAASVRIICVYHSSAGRRRT